MYNIRCGFMGGAYTERLAHRPAGASLRFVRRLAHKFPVRELAPALQVPRRHDDVLQRIWITTDDQFLRSEAGNCS